MRGRLEARRGCRGLLLEQRRQVGLGDAYRVGDLDHDALVERQLIALVQLVAVLVVRVAEEVAGVVVDHDAVVEGVELEEAIVPLLLLLAHVGRVEAAELGDGGRLRGGQLGGGQLRARVRRAAEGRRHGCSEDGRPSRKSWAVPLGCCWAVAVWRRADKIVTVVTVVTVITVVAV